MEDTETAAPGARRDLDLVAPSTKAFQERYGVSVQSKAIGVHRDCSCFFSLFLAVFCDLRAPQATWTSWTRCLRRKVGGKR
jgi:hypothetical protein